MVKDSLIPPLPLTHLWIALEMCMREEWSGYGFARAL